MANYLKELLGTQPTPKPPLTPSKRKGTGDYGVGVPKYGGGGQIGIPNKNQAIDYLALLSGAVSKGTYASGGVGVSGGSGAARNKASVDQKDILSQISLSRSPWASMTQRAPGSPMPISAWLGATATQNTDRIYPQEYYDAYGELIPPTNTVMPDTYQAQQNRLAESMGLLPAGEPPKSGGGWGGGWGGGGGGWGSYKSKLPRWYLDMMYWRI
jgi:hypothetical protein